MSWERRLRLRGWGRAPRFSEEGATRSRSSRGRTSQRSTGKARRNVTARRHFRYAETWHKRIEWCISARAKRVPSLLPSLVHVPKLSILCVRRLTLCDTDPRHGPTQSGSARNCAARELHAALCHPGHSHRHWIRWVDSRETRGSSNN